MKILVGDQIKAADRATIECEPVESINLMERAAEVISQWICNNIEQDDPLLFFVGKGNNGGDALSVARMLYHVGYNCMVYMAFDKSVLSEECRFNLERLPSEVEIVCGESLEIDPQTVIFDALLGSGVKGDLGDPLLSIVDLINSLPNRVISIDMPSGMKSEFGNVSSRIVQAETTLTLEFPKLAMMLPEAGECCGNIEVLPIDLDAEFIDEAQTPYQYITDEMIDDMLLPRAKFGHKGNYGHALLICGSEGMMGAAILAGGAALRSGCGLVTIHIPRDERFAVQASSPSAILSLDRGHCFTTIPDDVPKYSSIGVGCGVGESEESVAALKKLFIYAECPMILDADALNIIAKYDDIRACVPSGSILTPHLGELKRLVGEWKDEQNKMNLVCALAAELRSVIVVKGAHTMVCMPDGECYFNSTGSSAMAKGGCGDVLTGFITGLIARGYAIGDAALLGVYSHGLAGDRAADYYGVEGMNSSDIIDFLAETESQIK